MQMPSEVWSSLEEQLKASGLPDALLRGQEAAFYMGINYTMQLLYNGHAAGVSPEAMGEVIIKIGEDFRAYQNRAVLTHIPTVGEC